MTQATLKQVSKIGVEAHVLVCTRPFAIHFVLRNLLVVEFVHG